MKKINELIKQKISQILLKEIPMPEKTMATITDVQTSPDLSRAKVCLSVFPSEKEEETIGWLNKNSKQIKHQLGQEVVLRKMPDLLFIEDKAQDRVARIDDLIDKIHQEG